MNPHCTRPSADVLRRPWLHVLAIGAFAACRSSPPPEDSGAPAPMSIAISDARAERTPDGSGIAISIALTLDNPTEDFLYVPSTAASPFAGFRLAVSAEDGAEIDRLQQAPVESVGEAGRRTFILAKGLTTERAMSFSLNDPERKLRRVTLQAIGDLGPAPALKGLASNRLSVNVEQPRPEPQAPTQPPTPAAETPPPQPATASSEDKGASATAPVASPRPEPAAGPTSGLPRYPESERTHSTSISAIYVPVLKLMNDHDPTGLRQRGSFGDADVKWGTALGGRIAMDIGKRGDWNQGTTDFGILLLTSDHTVGTANDKVRSVQGYLELYVEGVTAPGPIQFIAGAGAGIGGIFIEMPTEFHDTGGLAGELRGTLGARLFRHVDVRAGPGFIVWGYPGETLGYGVMMTTEVGVTF